jgi:hypothetical protein
VSIGANNKVILTQLENAVDEEIVTCSLLISKSQDCQRNARR